MAGRPLVVQYYLCTAQTHKHANCLPIFMCELTMTLPVHSRNHPVAQVRLAPGEQLYFGLSTPVCRALCAVQIKSLFCLRIKFSYFNGFQFEFSRAANANILILLNELARECVERARERIGGCSHPSPVAAIWVTFWLAHTDQLWLIRS